MPGKGWGKIQLAVLAILRETQRPTPTNEIARILYESPTVTQRNGVYYSLALLEKNNAVQSTLEYPLLTKEYKDGRGFRAKPRRSKRSLRVWRLNGHDE